MPENKRASAGTGSGQRWATERTTGQSAQHSPASGNQGGGRDAPAPSAPQRGAGGTKPGRRAGDEEEE